MRVYTVVMNQISVTVAKSLIRLSAPSTAILILLRAWTTQDASEVSEQLPILIQRASTDGTGTAATARPHEVGDPVFAGTAVTDLTAEPTLTGDPINNESFNVLNGWVEVPMPEERFFVEPSGRVVLRLDAAPDAALIISAALRFGAIG